MQIISLRFVGDKKRDKNRSMSRPSNGYQGRKSLSRQGARIFLPESQGHVVNFLEESNGIPEKEKPQSGEKYSSTSLAPFVSLRLEDFLEPS